MKLDLTLKTLNSSPFLLLNDLKRYCEEFTSEHGEPEAIILNEDQKIWYVEAVKNTEEITQTTYNNIPIE